MVIDHLHRLDRSRFPFLKLLLTVDGPTARQLHQFSRGVSECEAFQYSECGQAWRLVTTAFLR